MSEELRQVIGSKTNSELKSILVESLIGTAGVMWVIGGILAILELYDVHWALGWLAGFVWVWGCWAAALYFDIKRFFHS